MTSICNVKSRKIETKPFYLIYLNASVAKDGNEVRETLECITVGGNSVGVRCKFPFIYDRWDAIPYAPFSNFRWFSPEQKFDSCTDYNFYKVKRKRWCATKVTPDNRYVPGHWGECPDDIACYNNGG